MSLMWFHMLLVFVSTRLSLCVSAPPETSSWCSTAPHLLACWGACVDKAEGPEQSCNPTNGLEVSVRKQEHVYNVLDVADREERSPGLSDCAAGEKRAMCTKKKEVYTRWDCEKYVSQDHPFCIYNGQPSDAVEGEAHLFLMVHEFDAPVNEQRLGTNAKLEVERTYIGEKDEKTVVKMKRTGEAQWTQKLKKVVPWTQKLTQKLKKEVVPSRTSYQVMTELNDKRNAIHMKVTLFQNKKEIPLFDALVAGGQPQKKNNAMEADFMYALYDDDDDEDDDDMSLLLDRLLSKAYKRGYMAGKLRSDYF